MLEQLKLKHLLVDVQRCQIINHEKIVSVEPRSMDVLVFLANHPGKVVSQQELFDALWPDTVFSPGAIQRCIAQLRKAMGDDARHPMFISTHPKRGYSLDVVPSNQQTRLTKNQIRLGSWLIVSLVFIVWLFAYEQRAKPLPWTGKLTPITSTSHYDFFPSYSSDGSKLAFIRQQGGQGHIYIKDIKSGVVRQLTHKSDDFLSIVWGDDDQSILFVVHNQNGDWVGQQILDDEYTNEIFRSEGEGDIWRVFPSDSGLYYMLVNVPVNKKPITRVRHYDLTTKVHTDLLLSSDEFTPYRIAMSPDQASIAIAGESAENKVEFRLLELNSGLLSKPFATLPLGFTEINWHPNGQALLVHHLNQLFSLTIDGEFTKLPYNNYQRLFNPVYHPKQHQISMSLSKQDTDLITFNPQTGKWDKVIDSDGEDHLARLSPNGKSIAYVSSRSGIQQLFISNNGDDISIFTNHENLPIYRAPVWSKKGNKLAFSFANHLFIYNIHTKNLNEISMPETFTSVLDWYLSDSRLLIAVKKENTSYLSEYDLDTRSSKNLVESGVNYSARLSNKDELVFHKDKLLYWGKRTFLLEELPEISGKIFPVEDELVFQSGRQVVSFDGQNYKVLVKELPQEADSIADVHSSDSMLLNSSFSQSAKIVALE